MMVREYVKYVTTLTIVGVLLLTDWMTFLGAGVVLVLLVKDSEISNQRRKEYITDFILISAALALYYTEWITLFGAGIILILLVNSIVEKYLEARSCDEDRQC